MYWKHPSSELLSQIIPSSQKSRTYGKHDEFVVEEREHMIIAQLVFPPIWLLANKKHRGLHALLLLLLLMNGK